MSKKIPNIFHLIYESKNIDFEPYIYFCIKSIIEINKPEIIYFYYNNLPKGKLWNKIENKLNLKKIDIPNNYLNNIDDFYIKYKKIIIYKNLIEYGGIYLDINSICINPLNNLLKYDFIKSMNDEIICSAKKSQFAYKYFQFYSVNLSENLCVDKKDNLKNSKNSRIIDKHDFYNIDYDDSEKNINYILFDEIYDYSFSTYFHLIKKCYFITFSNNKNNLSKINLYDIFNKITIYNLLIKHVLSYNFIDNNLEIINKTNYNFINNIDIIYWINLDKSIKRKLNMEKILQNINVKNIRINGIDGNIIDNINKKYFICDNTDYPKYSNKEYAILLSHLNTIETFSMINYSELKYGYALVCEDDLSIDFINYWSFDIKSIINNAPEDWDIIMLGYFSLNINFKELYKKWNNEWSAISYLVNHKSIQKIKDFKKDNKWNCNEYDLMVSDNYIFSKFNTYIYKYPYFTFPNNNDSTFHEDHLNYHCIYKNCNYLVLNNVYNDYLE